MARTNFTIKKGYFFFSFSSSEENEWKALINTDIAINNHRDEIGKEWIRSEKEK